MKHVENIMRRLDFPAAAREELLAALRKLLGNPASAARFRALTAQYDASPQCDYRAMLEEMTRLSQDMELHPYTGQMVLLLSLGERLRLRYAERGISEEIYWASMEDLRYKLEECLLVKGVVGTFVGGWFPGFFNLTRFALGRLQFELVELETGGTVNGRSVPAGSKAINIHIPRTGTRLERTEVLDAYDRAAAFFAGEFEQGPILFTCHSWLLYPWNLEVLKPASNLAQFIRDFTVIDSGEDLSYRDAWRLFDCEWNGDPEALPQDSSLRRAYAARIRAGEPLGWASGVFVYE